MPDKKHTPGPWTSHRATQADNVGGIDYAITDDHGKIIAEAFHRVGFGLGTGLYEERPAAANARLIAAAPELIDALRLCASHLAQFVEDDDSVGALALLGAHDALSKADGREPEITIDTPFLEER